MSMIDHDDQDRARQRGREREREQRRQQEREAAIRRTMPHGPGESQHVVLALPEQTEPTTLPRESVVVVTRETVDAYRVMPGDERSQADDRRTGPAQVRVAVPTDMLLRYQVALQTFREVQRELDRLYREATEPPPPRRQAYTL